jgi:hypothetical protein
MLVDIVCDENFHSQRREDTSNLLRRDMLFRRPPEIDNLYIITTVMTNLVDIPR